MKIFYFLLIAGAIPTCSLSPQHQPAIGEIPVKGYKLLWGDEFNGTNLDKSKWKYRNLGRRGDAYNSAQAIWLDGKGQLVIQVSQLGDSIFSGIIDSEGLFQTCYGYFECRASLTKTSGIWPGFWLQSSLNRDYGIPETEGAEIDIFEYFHHERKDTVSHTLHWGGYGSTHKKAGPVYSPLKKSEDGFHVFGLEWTADRYATYVDGVKTNSANTNISKMPEFIVLSLEVNKQVAGPIDTRNLPDRFVIDYVRVYKKK